MKFSLLILLLLLNMSHFDMILLFLKKFSFLINYLILNFLCLSSSDSQIFFVQLLELFFGFFSDYNLILDYRKRRY